MWQSRFLARHAYATPIAIWHVRKVVASNLRSCWDIHVVDLLRSLVGIGPAKSIGAEIVANIRGAQG